MKGAMFMWLENAFTWFVLGLGSFISFSEDMDHLVMSMCIESFLVLLEEGVCYDQCVGKTLLAFALLHSVL